MKIFIEGILDLPCLCIIPIFLEEIISRGLVILGGCIGVGSSRSILSLNAGMCLSGRGRCPTSILRKGSSILAWFGRDK